jgi:hypothetical protein
MPMSDNELEPQRSCSWVVLHIKCRDYCPALGMYARMWSGNLCASWQLCKASRRKDMKQQGSLNTLQPFDYWHVDCVPMSSTSS